MLLRALYCDLNMCEYIYRQLCKNKYARVGSKNRKQ